MAERGLVLEPLAVGEDADVLAEPPLIVEHIAAQLRLRREQRAKRLADRGARCIDGSLRRMLAQPGCESYLRHPALPVRRGIATRNISRRAPPRSRRVPRRPWSRPDRPPAPCRDGR